MVIFSLHEPLLVLRLQDEQLADDGQLAKQHVQRGCGHIGKFGSVLESIKITRPSIIFSNNYAVI